MGDISIQGAVAITWCRTPAHGWKTNAFEHRHRQARVSGSVSYESLKIFAETANEHKASLVPTDTEARVVPRQVLASDYTQFLNVLLALHPPPLVDLL